MSFQPVPTPFQPPSTPLFAHTPIPPKGMEHPWGAPHPLDGVGEFEGQKPVTQVPESTCMPCSQSVAWASRQNRVNAEYQISPLSLSMTKVLFSGVPRPVIERLSATIQSRVAIWISSVAMSNHLTVPASKSTVNCHSYPRSMSQVSRTTSARAELPTAKEIRTKTKSCLIKNPTRAVEPFFGWLKPQAITTKTEGKSSE